MDSGRMDIIIYIITSLLTPAKHLGPHASLMVGLSIIMMNISLSINVELMLSAHWIAYVNKFLIRVWYAPTTFTDWQLLHREAWSISVAAIV